MADYRAQRLARMLADYKQLTAHSNPMTENNFTPPPELVELWVDLLATRSDEAVFSLAAKWGADAELEKCCEVLDSLNDGYWSEKLRAARRKPPSLKEQALQALSEAVKMADDVPPEGICSDQADIIRRALEQLSE
jgi:hypothetical protein